MSLTKTRTGAAGPKNPAVKFISWKGADDAGFFAYYDKEADNGKGGKGVNVRVELKDVVILDQDLFSITGYRERDRKNIQSNEVRSVDCILRIQGWKDGKAELLKEGTYRDLKESIKDTGYMKYTRCVYAMLKGELVHIALTGNGVYELGNIEGSGRPEANYLNHTETVDKQNGKIKFRYPKFSFGDKFSDADYAKAAKLDEEVVQPYLEAYLNGKIAGSSNGASEAANDAPSTYDTSKWREYSHDGVPLGGFNAQEIRELWEDVGEKIDPESDFACCIGQALKDFQTTEKTWESKRDKTGRLLKDYTLQDLKAVMDKLPIEHPSTTLLHVAIAATSEGGSVDLEDCPF